MPERQGTTCDVSRSICRGSRISRTGSRMPTTAPFASSRSAPRSAWSARSPWASSSAASFEPGIDMEPSKTTGNGHPASPLSAASETLGQIGAGLQALASKESMEGLREKIDLPKRMKSNPYGTLAIALGAGYVLGGGLFSSLTRRVLGAGLKVGL